MTVTRDAHVGECAHGAKTSVGEVRRQRNTRIDDQLAVSEEPMDHAVARGRDESFRLRVDTALSITWRPPTSSRYSEPLRPDLTDSRTRCCKIHDRGARGPTASQRSRKGTLPS